MKITSTTSSSEKIAKAIRPANQDPIQSATTSSVQPSSQAPRALSASAPLTPYTVMPRFWNRKKNAVEAQNAPKEQNVRPRNPLPSRYSKKPATIWAMPKNTPEAMNTPATDTGTIPEYGSTSRKMLTAKASRPSGVAL